MPKYEFVCERGHRFAESMTYAEYDEQKEIWDGAIITTCLERVDPIKGSEQVPCMKSASIAIQSTPFKIDFNPRLTQLKDGTLNVHDI